MNNKRGKNSFWKTGAVSPLLGATLLMLAAIYQAGCRGLEDQPMTPTPNDTGTAQNETVLLNSTFRIDIQTIRVHFQFYPDTSTVEAESEMVFRMRSGQRRPVIHFDGILERNVLNSIHLDGEELRFNNPLDVRVITVEKSTQQAIELQRDLDGGQDHRLVITYRLATPPEYPRFATDVNDLRGTGNEELFPTINSPEELARHQLRFTVHGNRAYRCIGSGLVTDVSAAGTQSWTLDTEREVASYTVMFALMPAADTVYQERIIGGLPVRMMAYNSNRVSLDEAFAVLEPWLTALIRDLGPFPAPRGVSVFLTDSGGGMEYFGATISSAWALNHEVFHMYFGCAVLESTYRDSWLDEAINEWYEHSLNETVSPIDENYRSNMVSGRSPVSVGFDSRAYSEGSRIIHSTALAMGGRERMVEFLRHLVGHYSFQPFNTHKFLDYVEAFSGADMRDRYKNWVYGGAEDRYQRDHSMDRVPPDVNLSPSPEILEQYRRLKNRNGREQ